MTRPLVLVVEDDPSLREALMETLHMADIKALAAEDGEQALRILEQTQVGLVVSDVQMQPLDGFELLRRVKTLRPELPVILMTAYGTVQKAVQAMREGAADYLVKPFEARVLLEMLERYLPEAAESRGDLVAADPRTRELADLAARVARSEATVMISGESGTGKEVFARFVHQNSLRAEGPFVAINCAAIPENMLEAMLFGYEKGAFTGAYEARAGKFEQAKGGTLLLDEISEMDLALQAKLLRVLQEREVERLGGRKLISLDVRVLATSNRNLREEVDQGRFREDLFYRLNVFPLHIPPLYERPGDILPLTRRCIERHNQGQAAALSREAEGVLLAHSWPGNVRELDNVVQRALILSRGGPIKASDIHFEPIAGCNERAVNVADMAEAQMRGALDTDLKRREGQLILEALKAGNGSRKEAAQRLGISPRTLRYKLARLREAGVAIPG